MSEPPTPAPTGSATVPATSPMVFPQIARLELDELLTQLIDRAQDVLTTQGRLRALLSATNAVSSNLSLPMLLRRIVEAACDLIGAHYGALGVIGTDGKLEEFIQVGIDEAQVEQIGKLPTGGGLLGLLIEQPRPLRLEDLHGHQASVGFPANHPPMRTFLGLPVRVRDRVFGNIYLTEKSGGRQFTDEDEELLTALAGAAAVAIDHAQLYAETERRQQSMQAATEISQQILATSDSSLAMIADKVRLVAEADLCLVIAATSATDRPRVVAASGSDASNVRGLIFQSRRAYDAILVAKDVGRGDGDSAALAALAAELSPLGVRLGPLLAVPFHDDDSSRGLLLLSRAPGGKPFNAIDVSVVRLLADYTSVAVDLAQARRDAELVDLLKDRDRIAHEMHDQVVSRLFAAGLSLQSLAARLPDEETRVLLRQEVDGLDDVIATIRRSIFAIDPADT